MKWACLGLNYRTAPVEIRELFAVSNYRVPEMGASLLRLPGVRGTVILSTCNRMEVYLSMDKGASVVDVKRWLLDRHGLDSELDTHFYESEGMDTARHLSRVLSGLDSMVLGETEILGQVKKSYSLAMETGLTDGFLNRLFQRSFAVGKRVRTCTTINQGSTSIGSVAVDLAEEIFGSLSQTKVLILGAGEMSRVTAQALQSRGASGIFVTNRTYDRAVELADMMGGEAIRYDCWAEYLKKVDIVIASTAAPHYIVKPEDISALRAARKYRSLFLIDISVPRNVDPAVTEIDEVYLYDIDTLRALADSAREQRKKAIEDCEAIIEKEVTVMMKKMERPPLVIGTRGSALAIAQADSVVELISRKYPEMIVSLKIIKTTGDIRTDVPLSMVAQASGIVDKGIFIKELENALLSGEIDMAVHSLKDMPSELDPRFKLGAVLPRESVCDVVVSKRGRGEDALPPNAVVATGSVRRKMQLMQMRPDIKVAEIRGNVPTRLEKLIDMEEWDALLLSEAGLNRLGITKEVLEENDIPLYLTPFEPGKFLPAAGQGAVAIEMRAEDSRLGDLLAPLNDPVTEAAVSAERGFLRLLGAGCATPVGVYSVMEGEELTLNVCVFNEDDLSSLPVKFAVKGGVNDPKDVARKAFVEFESIKERLA